MLISVVGLENYVFVVVEFEPSEAVEDRAGRFLSRACNVRILNTEQEFSTCATGVKVIKQGSSGTADVKVAGW